MAAQDFRVYISGGTVSIDAWRQAMEAGEDKLPALSEDQREAARIVAMTEPEYARGVLADELGKRQQQEIGRKLGEIIAGFLPRIPQGWKLESLVRKGIDRVWLAHFESGGITDEVAIPTDLVDDVVESDSSMSRKRLERLLGAKLDSSVRRVAS